MSLDDATVLDLRTTDGIPGPRTAALTPVPDDLPWADSWSPGRAVRPSSEYWDVETARWTRRAPVPSPRRGD